MLPDTLHLLDRSDRRGYASILAHMASTDGDISVEELATFEGRLGNALIAPMSRKELRLELKRPKPIALAAREMSEESLMLALRDALLLAAADGVFEAREKELIRKIADEAGVSDEELEGLYIWVDEGWAWMRRGRGLLGLEAEEGMYQIVHEDEKEVEEVEAEAETEEAEPDVGEVEDEDPTDTFEESDYDVFEDIEDTTDMKGIDFGGDEDDKKRRPSRRK